MTASGFPFQAYQLINVKLGGAAEVLYGRQFQVQYLFAIIIEDAEFSSLPCMYTKNSVYIFMICRTSISYISVRKVCPHRKSSLASSTLDVTLVATVSCPVNPPCMASIVHRPHPLIGFFADKDPLIGFHLQRILQPLFLPVWFHNMQF